MKRIHPPHRGLEAVTRLHGHLNRWANALRADVLRLRGNPASPAAWILVLDDASSRLANAAHSASRRDFPSALKQLAAAIHGIEQSECRHDWASTLDALKNLHHIAVLDFATGGALTTAARGE